MLDEDRNPFGACVDLEIRVFQFLCDGVPDSRAGGLAVSFGQDPIVVFAIEPLMGFFEILWADAKTVLVDVPDGGEYGC